MEAYAFLHPFFSVIPIFLVFFLCYGSVHNSGSELSDSRLDVTLRKLASLSQEPVIRL